MGGFTLVAVYVDYIADNIADNIADKCWLYSLGIGQMFVFLMCKWKKTHFKPKNVVFTTLGWKTLILGYRIWVKKKSSY